MKPLLTRISNSCSRGSILQKLYSKCSLLILFKHLYKLWKIGQQQQSCTFFQPKSIDILSIRDWQTFFCKGPDSIYIFSMLWATWSLPLWESSHRQDVNKWSQLCSNRTLWSLKFEFHIIFSHHKIFFFKKFFCNKLQNLQL